MIKTETRVINGREELIYIFRRRIYVDSGWHRIHLRGGGTTRLILIGYTETDELIEDDYAI